MKNEEWKTYVGIGLAIAMLTVALLFLFLGCGGDDGSENNIGQQMNLPDDGRIVVRKIAHPDSGFPVYCIVATSSGPEARAVAISCDWP